MPKARPPGDFDHHDSKFAERSLDIFAEMREKCPVAHSSRYGGFWALTRYREVAEVARDDETYSSDKDFEGERRGYQGITVPPGSVSQTVPIEMDPPEFLGFRKVLNPYFSPAMVERQRPLIRRVTDACIDAHIESGQIDLTVDLGSPVPATMTMHLLGLPLEEARRFADATHASICTPPDSPDRERVMKENEWVRSGVWSVIEERKREPRDDLISGLLQSEVNGRPFTDQEIFSISGLVIAGGVDTTTALFSNAVIYLDRNREARQQLIDRPELIPSACEEFLRYYTPVQALARTATRDTELAGEKIAAGERLLMCWASANHDADVFNKPNEIVLDRYPNRHTSFGLGVHRCLGSNLARAQFCSMLEQVLERMPDYRVLHDDAERYESIGVVNGWVKTPAMFAPGPRVTS